MGSQLPFTEKGTAAPPSLFGPCLLWLNGRPSQQLMSSCRGPSKCFCCLFLPGRHSASAVGLYAVAQSVTVTSRRSIETTGLVQLQLLRPRERLRSIVISMSICLSVREDISGTKRTIFTKFIVRVAYVRGSVLLRHVDDRPHRLSAGRG